MPAIPHAANSGQARRRRHALTHRPILEEDSQIRGDAPARNRAGLIDRFDLLAPMLGQPVQQPLHQVIERIIADEEESTGEQAAEQSRMRETREWLHLQIYFARSHQVFQISARLDEPAA